MYNRIQLFLAHAFPLTVVLAVFSETHCFDLNKNLYFCNK